MITPQPIPGAPRTGLSLTRLLAFVLLPGLSGLVSSSQAQTATPQKEEILALPAFTVSTTQDVGYRAGNSVSATRIDTAIKDLPFTISAFTEQFIDDIGALDLQDILRFAPGVTSGDKSFVAGNNRFSIRGFDGDVPPQRNGFTGNRNTDSSNVTRVEVIKGPASLLYGQIIPGGTINYITKRPTSKKFISIKQSFGNENDYRTVLDINTPIGKKIGTRVVASYNQDADWAESGSSSSWLFAPSLSFQLTPKVSLVLDYERLSRRESPSLGMMPNVQIAGFSGAPSASTFVKVSDRSYQQGLYDGGSINLGFLGTIPIPSTFNYQDDNDYKKADYENMNAELNVQLGSHWVARANYSWAKRDVFYKLTGLAQWDVTPTAAYRTTTSSYFDYLNEYLANPTAVLNDSTKTASVLLARRKRLQTNGDAYNTYQLDLSGKYEFSGIKLSPLFGAYRQYGRTGGGKIYSSSSGYTGGFSDTNGALPFTPWNYFDSSTWNKNLDYDPYASPDTTPLTAFTYSLEDAYYGVLTANLLDDRLILVGGARYDRYRSGATTFGFEAKKTTPQIGVGYHLTKDSLLFANYSKSFLVEGTTLLVENPTYNPAINANPTTNPLAITVPATPTTGSGYEVGFKTDFLGGRISSTITAFHLERADRIVSVRQPVVGLNATGVLTTTGLTYTKQGTVDQSEGVEFEITYSPLDNWQIYATYAGMQIETTKISTPTPRLATDSKVSGDYAQYLAGFNQSISLIQGAVPEGSSERLASIWTRYSFKSGPLKSLWVAGGGNYTSPKAQRTANPSLFFPAYYLWDAVVGYNWKQGKQSWDASINFKNITDKVYYPANQARGKPRQIVLTVGTKF